MTSREAGPEPPHMPPASRMAWVAWIIGWGLAPAALYAAALVLIAAMDGQTFAEALCFHPDRMPSAPFDRKAAAALGVLSSLGFLFIAPGVLGTLAIRRRSVRGTAHVWNLGVNTVALILLFLVLRATVGLGRISLTLGWACWTMVLAALAYPPGQSRNLFAQQVRRGWRPLVIGLSFVLASAGCFFAEQFLQCFNEDGTEAYELARSLRSFALPTWEIETSEVDADVHYGPVVVNPSLINSYWTSALQILLGDCELATRLPYWVWWLAIYWMGCRLIELTRSEPAHWLDLGLLGLLVLLVSVLFSFYVGYNPYMADLANPGVTNALFTLCFLLMLECLFHRDAWAFAMAALLASLVFYSGVVMLILILISAWLWQPIPRKEIWRFGRLSASLLALVGAGYVFYGANAGVLGLWVEALELEYVSDYLAPVSRWQSAPLFLGYFILGSGGVAAWGLARAFRQGAWQQTVATATCGYLAIVLMSGFKNLHYLGPLFPIPLLLWLSSLPRKRWKPRLLLGGSLVVCLGLSWPITRQTFVLNRHFGEQTTFATDSYPEAVGWARLRYGLQQAHLLTWDCDQHTWVAYARLDRQMANPGPFLVTTVPPPSAEYQLIAIGLTNTPGRAARLYVRDPKLANWLRSQEPLGPLKRYPWIFRPLAAGRFSPHQNQLE